MSKLKTQLEQLIYLGRQKNLNEASEFLETFLRKQEELKQKSKALPIKKVKKIDSMVV